MIKDNRLRPIKIQPQDSGDAVTQQEETNELRGIEGAIIEEAPQYRGDVQGYPNVTPVGVAPVDRD